MDYIDQHKHRFGVEPICEVLRAEGIAVAPSGYYAHKARPPATRTLADAALAETIEATFFDREKGRGVYGVRKMWHQLRRDGITGPDGQPVARCSVERLMRSLGLRGARRGRPVWTTRPDRRAERAPDLVDRQFHAERPNQLWVVDLTYVPTWSGTVFTAFVSDVYSRRIVGWRCAASMPTELPLDALEMALWTRQRAGHTWFAPGSVESGSWNSGRVTRRRGAWAGVVIHRSSGARSWTWSRPDARLSTLRGISGSARSRSTRGGVRTASIRACSRV